MSDIQERELWSVAVFRLRESANRIFSLATRVRSLEIRGQLLRIYEQLRAEEAKLAALADAAEQMAENALRQPTPPQMARRIAAESCRVARLANGEGDD
jgi:LmbE family N-acetylglucosaminyl deacetylase